MAEERVLTSYQICGLFNGVVLAKTSHLLAVGSGDYNWGALEIIGPERRLNGREKKK